jgi:hypothetical protein
MGFFEEGGARGRLWVEGGRERREKQKSRELLFFLFSHSLSP